MPAKYRTFLSAPKNGGIRHSWPYMPGARRSEAALREYIVLSIKAELLREMECMALSRGVVAERIGFGMENAIDHMGRENWKVGPD